MESLLATIPEQEFIRSAAARGVAGPPVRVDMHCHSRFSVERIRVPRMIFHPLLEPEESYDMAIARGMDFVTLTDHDTIDGCKALLDRRGDLPNFFFGEEVSVRFPEDRTLIHVNVYDITEREHDEIQRVRDNLYDFVDYVTRIGRLFVLNHMTWNAQHRVLTSRQIETMLRLFPAFEALNGTRSYAHNAFTLRATAGHHKSLVAGSDSHTHRVGTTFTLTFGATVRELLDNVRRGATLPCGEWGTAEKLREDVWLTIQKNVERRVEAASGAWGRFWARRLRQLGRAVYPAACLGYTARQNSLIRGFARELPA
ncbi:MAG: PHP domain-containing protein [Planctomycetia bacterium]|nr:MAG: PHP domain-containing protein [Planctomycetia bacterium]